MMHKTFNRPLFFLTLFLSASLPFSARAATLELENAGLPPATLWSVPAVLVEGEAGALHTIVYNANDGDLDGTMGFYDGSLLLGEKKFHVATNGVSDVSIIWAVTAGAHNLYAEIENATRTLPHKSPETISVTVSKTASIRPVVPKTILVKEALPENAKEVLGQVDETKGVIGSAVGAGIMDKAIAIFDSIDAKRGGFADRVKDKRDGVKDALNKATLEENHIIVDENPSGTKVKTNAFDRPLMSVEKFFLDIALFIIGTPIVFYGIIIALVIFIVKRIIRRAKRRQR